ncbi:hypothetical protein HYH03_015802 [Edaphochlamys debaryana]|uniref:Uncharacterized protein n=1 Tax=Edaphochlamys debaryana TaxID=47281 RepID=A0A835XR10_9CHLO|nr:hypothetical protein HYH03_015802 [Edaphochlamys debaryana]|eukprot:KAG2485420.1 hypothetical protein HYH03_015802 [Edaphochlamys debaryana]
MATMGTRCPAAARLLALPRLLVPSETSATVRSLATSAQGPGQSSRPSRSELSDLQLEDVFGRYHQHAREQLEQAQRDAVAERLCQALGRRKGRPLELEALQRLPAEVLEAARTQARLPPSAGPAATAASLHAWLHPSSSTPSSPFSSSNPSPTAPTEPLRRASWHPLSSATSSSAADLQGGAANLGPGRAQSVNEEDEAARLRAQAEAEADALFDEELQQRLSQATAAAASRASTSGPVGSTGGGTLQGQAQGQPGGTGRGARSPPFGTGLGVGADGGVRATATELLAEEAQLAAAGSAAAAAAAGARAPAVTLPRFAGGAASASASQLFTPLPSAEAEAAALPAAVAAAVRRRLARQGFFTKDPSQLRSLLLLSRAALFELAQDFGVEGSGQSREQLAVALARMMAPQPTQPQRPPTATASTAGSGLPLGAAQRAEAPAAQAPLGLQAEQGVEARVERAVEARAGVEVVLEAEEGAGAGAGAEVGPAWDLEAAALGDPRRLEVLREAAERQRLVAAAAVPEQIATWLVKARAQDVLLYRLPAESAAAAADALSSRRRQQTSSIGRRGRAQTAPGPGPEALGLGLGPAGEAEDERQPGAASGVPPGRGARGPCVVLATALSQRHAYACAEAVRYQVRDRLQELASAGPAGPGLGLAVRWAPAVAGVNGGDWLSLEAGDVQVHVLTAQARQYYRLEALLQSAASQAGGVQAFGPAAGERRLDTIETARVDPADAGAQ